MLFYGLVISYKFYFVILTAIIAQSDCIEVIVKPKVLLSIESYLSFNTKLKLFVIFQVAMCSCLVIEHKLISDMAVFT